MSRTKLYLLSLAITLFGVVLFIISAKRIAECQGLLLLSIAAMIGPISFVAFDPNSYGLGRTGTLLLVIIPLVFVNYIYFITMGKPVGFQDTHNHIHQYSLLFGEDKRLSPSDATTVSYAFVGLYLLSKSIVDMCSFDITFVAVVAPPLVNLFLVLTVYALINRLHSHRIALLATVLFGWENQVIIFGQEYRTQTQGTLLIVACLVAYLVFQRASYRGSSSRSILYTILLLGIVMASFVSIVYALLVFIPIVFMPPILKTYKKWQEGEHPLTLRLYVLFIAFSFSYLAYVANGFDNLAQTLAILLNQMIDDAQTNPTLSVGQIVYGDYVSVSTYLLWGLFAVFSILYLGQVLEVKHTRRMAVLVAFGALILFALMNNLVGSLSVGRVYAIAFIIIATVLSFGLASICTGDKARTMRSARRIGAVILVIIFVSSSVVKIPSYVIGDTSPIRDEQTIDDIPYWSVDLPQYEVVSFLTLHADNQGVEAATFIRNYEFLELLDDVDSSIPTLFVLENEFRGDEYTFRNELPTIDEFNSHDQIYANGDYIVFRGI